jgi:hypothetical protein
MAVLFLSVLSWLFCPGFLSWRSCTFCPVLTVLSWLFFHECHFLAS